MRTKLIDQGDRLAKIAEHTAPDEFARAVRDETRRLESDADAVERLERQRRAIRCNSWTDKATGMGRWSVTLDPATWLGLENRLDAQIEAMFHDTHPEGCPTDLLEKQSFLRAHALLALLNGQGARSGARRSSSSRTTPTRSPMVDRDSIGVPMSICPASSSTCCDHEPRSIRSPSATASSSTHPAS